MSKSSQGLLWSFFGVLILSPDSLLIRLLNLNDFSLIFYRSFLPAVTIFLFLYWFYKRDTLKVFLLGFFFTTTSRLSKGFSISLGSGFCLIFISKS